MATPITPSKGNETHHLFTFERLRGGTIRIDVGNDLLLCGDLRLLVARGKVVVETAPERPVAGNKPAESQPMINTQLEPPIGSYSDDGEEAQRMIEVPKKKNKKRRDIFEFDDEEDVTTRDEKKKKADHDSDETIDE